MTCWSEAYPGNTSTIRTTFKNCGETTRIEIGKDGKNTAAVHFKDYEGRVKALELNNTMIQSGGVINVEGLAKRYTTDPMDILQAHSNTLG